MTNRTELPAATDFDTFKGTLVEFEDILRKADIFLTYAPARKRFVEILDTGICNPRLAYRLAMIRQGKAEERASLGFII